MIFLHLPRNVTARSKLATTPTLINQSIQIQFMGTFPLQAPALLYGILQYQMFECERVIDSVLKRAYKQM